MKLQPAAPYSGLAIILSQPSRFDLREGYPLSGAAGLYFRSECIGSRLFLDSFVMDCFHEICPLPEGTKVVLLLGIRACKRYIPEAFSRPGLGLHSLRGTPVHKDGITYIPSYSPQETFDVQPYEQEKNPCLNGEIEDLYGEESFEDEEEAGEDGNTKDLTNTRQRNWRYWLTQDCNKAKCILRDGYQHEELEEHRLCLKPAMSYIVAKLNELTTKDNLYLDIETDADLNVLCIGLGFDDESVCVIPLLDYNYAPAYPFSKLGIFLKALQAAFLRAQVVIHNSHFDLFVLAHKYNLTPPIRVWDTMLVQHRINPEPEKSLGHCISLYTSLPYHKDEGVFQPHNSAQQESLMRYNAKDVFAMRLIHVAQEMLARRDTGLWSSIQEANASVVPYLVNSLHGILVDVDQLNAQTKKNDALLVQYQRVINTLVGPRVNLLPSSSQSCAKYFHDLLRYKVVKRTDTGAPSVDEGALYQIALAYPDNIVVPFTIAYRGTLKENAVKKIILWSLPEKLLLNTIRATTPTKPLFGEETKRLASDTATGNQFLIPTTENSSAAGQSTGALIRSLREYPPFDQQDSPSPMSLVNPQSIQTLRKHNRITTGWKLTGTKTFRKASSKLLGKWGANLQNPSRAVLHLHKADQGYQFVQVDQAGAEALVVSYLTEHGAFRDLFLNGIKSHVYVALHIFIDEWTKTYAGAAEMLTLKPAELKAHPEWKALDKVIKKADMQYALAKMVCHASNYGMGPKAFTLNVLKQSGGRIVLTTMQAQKFLGTYHRLFPEIQRWHIEIEEEVRKTRMLRNMFGYPRRFWSYFGEENAKEMYAFKPQSTVGCITTQAFTQMFHYIEDNKLDWHLLNDKHDSYLVQAPVSDAVFCAKKMQEFIEVELTGRDGVKFRMRSEASIGENWGKYHPVKNPGGMRELTQ